MRSIRLRLNDVLAFPVISPRLTHQPRSRRTVWATHGIVTFSTIARHSKAKGVRIRSRCLPIKPVDSGRVPTTAMPSNGDTRPEELFRFPSRFRRAL